MIKCEPSSKRNDPPQPQPYTAAGHTRQISADVAAGVLLAVAGLHGAWACQRYWPAKSAASLAKATAGREPLPGPIPCWTVAGLLTMAAGMLVAENGDKDRVPKVLSDANRFGVGIVAGVLTVRSAGVAVSALPVPMSREFRILNGVVYSPLCAVLAWAAWRRYHSTRP